jgi:hypothetical protein
MDSQLLELLKKKLEDERKAVVENLADGGAKDFAQYQNLCGIIRGLLTAQREINDLLRKLKDEDDD